VCARVLNSLQPTQAELVLLTLRALPEEIVELTAVALEGRRRDILEGLNSALPALFAFFSQVHTPPGHAVAAGC
jgi:hypothetical protein